MAGYLGNVPTAVPLTSADITDGIITSAKIANGTITTADLASGVGGKVLQVIAATDSTSRSTTSTSFVTGSNTLSVTITPSSSSNKIIIFVNHYSFNDTSPSYYTIYRGATNLGNTDGFAVWNSRAGNQAATASYNYLDSPATTSAITYQVYFKASTGIAYLCDASIKSQIMCFEIAG